MEKNKETKKTLVNKPRCQKGFIRDKTGNCIPKPQKEPKQKSKKNENPTGKSTKKNKTRKIVPKKMSKKDAVKILKERRECIQRFREKLE